MTASTANLCKQRSQLSSGSAARRAPLIAIGMLEQPAHSLARRRSSHKILVRRVMFRHVRKGLAFSKKYSESES